MGGSEEQRQQEGTGEGRMGWLSAVAIGATTPGLSRPTLLMNAILVGLLLSFAALLPAALRYSRPPGGDSGSSSRGSGSVVEGGSSEMLYHMVFLLLLTLLLIALLNWWVPGAQLVGAGCSTGGCRVLKWWVPGAQLTCHSTHSLHQPACTSLLPLPHCIRVSCIPAQSNPRQLTLPSGRLAWEVGTVSANSQARQLLAPAGSSHGAAHAHNAIEALDAQEDASGARGVHGKRHKKKRQSSKRSSKGRR
ncbi:unnamed protein product [Closterium sp. Naga37s-1]|nr:unnamed protein product [Closterium sp. Naga37s-1]